MKETVKDFKYVGGIYDGEIEDGLPNGRGVFRYPNGNIYDGEFKNGNLHGHGILYQKSGMVIDGEFENGETVREIRFQANGYIYVAEEHVGDNVKFVESGIGFHPDGPVMKYRSVSGKVEWGEPVSPRPPKPRKPTNPYFTAPVIPKSGGCMLVITIIVVMLIISGLVGANI